MTLSILPEHGIRDLLQEPSVAHIHFANESGMRRFIADNRQAIRSMIERWDVNWTPMLTITATR